MTHNLNAKWLRNASGQIKDGLSKEVLLCIPDPSYTYFPTKIYGESVADPGFPLGGGRQPPTRTLFSENVCENKRNRSCCGGHVPAAPLDPPMRILVLRTQVDTHNSQLQILRRLGPFGIISTSADIQKFSVLAAQKVTQR